MTLTKIALASLALVAAAGANAAVTGTIIAPPAGPFLTLTNAGSFMSGSTVVGTETGGQVLATTTTSSTMPVGTVGNYLSDLGNGTTTLNFSSGVAAVSFLWGTPDEYNMLSVNGTTFTAMSLGFPSVSGTAGTGQYVQFTGTAGTLITNLVFSNAPNVNSFETANYSVTPVPEPETYALLLGGLGLVGFVARRRG